MKGIKFPIEKKGNGCKGMKENETEEEEEEKENESTTIQKKQQINIYVMVG